MRSSVESREHSRWVVRLLIYGAPWIVFLLILPINLYINTHWEITDRIGALYYIGVGGGSLTLLVGGVLGLVLRVRRRGAYPHVFPSWALAGLAIFLQFELYGVLEAIVKTVW